MINNHTKKIIFSVMCDKSKMIQAVKIAIVVGTILNIINQGNYLFNLNFDKMNFFKLTLTYFVPFFVSTYTAFSIGLQIRIGDKATISTKLKCKKCKSILHVNKNTTIPLCPKCGINGIWKTTS